MANTHSRSALLIGGITLAVALTGWLGAAPEPVFAAPTYAALVPLAKSGPSITSQPGDATVGRYGTRTKATFSVAASGSKLRYRWQSRPAQGGSWANISGATTASYKAKASAWASGTRFRVRVTGTGGETYSDVATLTVLSPTKTPAADAEKAFGLTGLTQGVDVSAWQYTPAAKLKVDAITDWVGKDGFVILRNGSGARPIKQSYVDTCTNRTRKTGSTPVVQDCAYERFADQVSEAGRALGHYWFNGWISTIDTTKKQLFAGGYTPKKAARQFVRWLLADGHYTKKSTDPLVLDIETGSAWTKTSKGTTYRLKLRAWKPEEATTFLTTVKDELAEDGYQANLYVYMSANHTLETKGNGSYAWTGVAKVARLWVASWGTDNGRIPATVPQVGPWASQGGWSIWQYTSNARIAGSGVGALDGDIAQPDAWTPRD